VLYGIQVGQLNYALSMTVSRVGT